MSADFSKLTHEQMTQIWPQAAKELSGFAGHLDTVKASSTADQLRLAIDLANRYYGVTNAVVFHLDPPTKFASGVSIEKSPEGRYDARISIDKMKNAIAMVQKFYQIFMTIMDAIGPLLADPPTPTPGPGSSGTSGNIFGTTRPLPERGTPLDRGTVDENEISQS